MVHKLTMSSAGDSGLMIPRPALDPRQVATGFFFDHQLDYLGAGIKVTRAYHLDDLHHLGTKGAQRHFHTEISSVFRRGFMKAEQVRL